MLNRRCPVLLLAVPTLLAAILLAGCGDDESDSPADSPATGGAQATTSVSGDLTVFAAASLTSAFEEIKTAFHRQNPGVRITYNFAGSPALRTQLTEGARADIYAPADTTNMQQALDAGLVVDAGEIFTRNRLAIIVPADNPGRHRRSVGPGGVWPQARPRAG